MSYQSPYAIFYCESYDFDEATRQVTFRYSFDKTRQFEEIISFASVEESINCDLLEKTLQLAHVLLGLSYYKTFPTKHIEVASFQLSDHQAEFFSEVYRDGLSQYVFENSLEPSDIARFESASVASQAVADYAGEGMVVMQSGGKDSLLLAELVKRHEGKFTTVYVDTGKTHPRVIEEVGANAHRDIHRHIDRAALAAAAHEGGLNGHVPITYMFITLAFIDIVLHNESTLLLAVGQEGEEPYASIGNYAIRHQWSKTWRAEQLMMRYVEAELSSHLKVGSPLRAYTELKIAELFSKNCWQTYAGKFSSCNIGNYMQGQANEELVWCGECAKCANSFLLFAPFVESTELQKIFGGNLFTRPLLTDTFRGLLGVDGAVKPFECVGETDELRMAYHMARQRFPDAGYKLPFAVPESHFDLDATGPAQQWATAVIQ